MRAWSRGARTRSPKRRRPNQTGNYTDKLRGKTSPHLAAGSGMRRASSRATRKLATDIGSRRETFGREFLAINGGKFVTRSGMSARLLAALFPRQSCGKIIFPACQKWNLVPNSLDSGLILVKYCINVNKSFLDKESLTSLHSENKSTQEIHKNWQTEIINC